MATLTEVLKAIRTLSEDEIKALKTKLLDYALSASSLQDFMNEKRFADGYSCPHCGGTHIVRNGRRKDGSQRYLCRECGKSFGITTNSIAFGTRKDFSVWETYMDCMINGMTLSRTAELCGMHRNTAFVWRHKILDALQMMAKDVVLSGIVEADETYLPVSYKGNHSKDGFSLPRKAHKRGKSIKKRGLSKEHVCIPCAVNRSGLSIAKAANLGAPSGADIKSVFSGRIEKGATLVIDKTAAYNRLSKDEGLTLIKIESGKRKKGIYHIQHINSYHNELKRFLAPFRGVSTKYLDNYLIWHNFAGYAKETLMEKKNILISFVLSQNLKENVTSLSIRSSLS